MLAFKEQYAQPHCYLASVCDNRQCFTHHISSTRIRRIRNYVALPFLTIIYEKIKLLNTSIARNYVASAHIIAAIDKGVGYMPQSVARFPNAVREFFKFEQFFNRFRVCAIQVVLRPLSSGIVACSECGIYVCRFLCHTQFFLFLHSSDQQSSSSISTMELSNTWNPTGRLQARGNRILTV